MAQESSTGILKMLEKGVYEQTSILGEIKKNLENVLNKLNTGDDCCLFDSERQAICNEITNKIYSSYEKIKSTTISEKVRGCLIMLLSIADREKTVKEIKNTINLVLSMIEGIENESKNTSTDVPVNDELTGDTKVPSEKAAKRNDKIEEIDKEFADHVKDLIKHLPNASEISIDDKEKIENAIQEYNNLTDYQKHLVGQDYMKYFLVKKEFERIEEIVNPINELIDSLPELGDVETYDEYRIKSVQNLYKGFSEDLMRNIKYKKVENLLTIIRVKLLIKTLPDPGKVNSFNSNQIENARENVENARENYEKLPDELKKHIDINKLIDCETKLKVCEIIELITELPEPIKRVIDNNGQLIQRIRRKYNELPDLSKNEIYNIEVLNQAEMAFKRFSTGRGTDFIDDKEQQRIRKKVFSYMKKYKPKIEISPRLYLGDINKHKVYRGDYVCITIPPKTQSNETPKYAWEIQKEYKIEFFITESGFSYEGYRINGFDNHCINADKLEEISDIVNNYIEACCAGRPDILNVLNDKTGINYLIDLIKQKLRIPENKKIIYDSGCYGAEIYDRNRVLLNRNSRFTEDEM